jgi:antitoxin (DNA-binding transcriptional repressor) of toxin-antitoxin stability system
MTVSIEEAQSKLSELVDELAPEEELVLQKRWKAVATLLRLEDAPEPNKRLLGSAKREFIVPDRFHRSSA